MLNLLKRGYNKLSKFYNFTSYVLYSSSFSLKEIYSLLFILSLVLFRRDTKANRYRLASKISDLGIVAIKLGQWMSFFLQAHYQNNSKMALLINSLPILQNSCKKEKSIFLDAYVQKFEGFLSSYDKDIYKSASIGQLYKATGRNGEPLLIKIKHDNIAEEIQKWETSFEYFFEIFFQEDSNKINLDEFFSNLKLQLDFTVERDNMILYSKIFKKNPLVRIPKFIAGDQHVLIMEYVPSQIFSSKNMSDDEKEWFQRVSLLMFQETVFVHNVLHGDLHQGNFGYIRKSDTQQQQPQQLVLYDFGLIIKDKDDAFKKFFLLSHISSKRALTFFLERYNLTKNDDEAIKEEINNMSEYVGTIVKEKKLDVISGIKIVMKLFKNQLQFDNFMYSVLSTSIFIGNLMDNEIRSDVDKQVEESIQFCEKNKPAFIKLNTLLKFCFNSYTDQKKDVLIHLYNKFYGKTVSSSPEIVQSTETMEMKKKIQSEKFTL